MAYYLAFTDATEYVSIPALPEMGNFDIEIKFSTSSIAYSALVGSNTPSDPANSNRHFRIHITSAGVPEVFNGTEVITGTSALNDGLDHTIVYQVRNHTGGFSGTSKLFVDGVQEGATKSFRGAPLANSTVIFLGRSVSSAGTVDANGINLKQVSVIDYDASSNTRVYDPSATFGTGLILEDTENSEDGSLTGFSGDDSQWIYYDDGGGEVESSGDFELPQITFVGSASASIPQPIATGAFDISSITIDGNVSASIPQPSASGAFSIGSIGISGESNATLPNPTANGEFTLSSITINGGSSATLPQPSATGQFELSAITIVGNASATLTNATASGYFDISSITFDGSASATLPQPSALGQFDIGSISLTGSATATEPVFSASGEFELSAIQFSATASVTIPQPIASGSFNLRPIQISGKITVSGIVINPSKGASLFFDAGDNHILLTTGNNKINLP